MERSEAIKLVQVSYCADCNGTGEGKHPCNYEKDCDGFNKEVDKTLEQEEEAG